MFNFFKKEDQQESAAKIRGREKGKAAKKTVNVAVEEIKTNFDLTDDEVNMLRSRMMDAVNLTKMQHDFIESLINKND